MKQISLKPGIIYDAILDYSNNGNPDDKAEFDCIKEKVYYLQQERMELQ